MNVMNRVFSLLLGVLALTGATAAARAGETESPLGSPAASSTVYTSDYDAAVQAALPRVDAGTLNRILSDVISAADAERPLAIDSVVELELFFGLPRSGVETTPRAKFVDNGTAAYRVDPGQHIYLTQRYGGVEAVSRAVGARQLPEIRSAHIGLASRLGIPTTEIHFLDFREVLSKTDGHPTLQDGVQGDIESEGAVSTFLRAVGGVQVEGSYLRLASIDPSRLELADIRWPRLRLSREVAKNGLRAPRDAAAGIVDKVRADSRGGAVALHMAVVLRPLDARALEFVPSLKIGVEPKSIAVGDGFRTDAGEVFYVDLLRNSPPLADLPAGTDETGSDR